VSELVLIPKPLATIEKMRLVKLTILLVIAIFSFKSCINLNSCNKDFFGRYYCNNIEGFTNYLDLNNDGSFSHYFKNDTIEITNFGQWEKTNDGYCTIELRKWKTFNQDGVNYEIYNNKFLYINRDYLDMGPDGESSTSFKKE